MSEYEKQQTRATAGPAADDRFGAGPVAQNLASRILKADVVGDRTRITIARGKLHGVHVGMEGFIKSAQGALADFQIDDVADGLSYAFVDVTVDQLTNNLSVMINTSWKPSKPLTEPANTRVIAVHVERGRTKITIARGTAQGVRTGMRGQLLATDGREGDDFTIDYATAIQSFAYLASPVDHVNQYKNAVLHPRPSDAPIQRHANGAASTADVQTTAQAGVAGATSRLPHFDTIQRAFGKHDISNIGAQVGGPATQASQALGAHAYATGDKVAFASSPDLHTAAHEAAHTIQQRHGAVGFQGLGAADDEHERHADAVADAVVAGKSAEPLLDSVVGGSSATAIQRKTAREQNADRFQKQVDQANAARQAEAAVFVAADILRSESGRAGAKGDYAAALALLVVAVTGKKERQVVSSRVRLEALEDSVTELASAFRIYGTGPEQLAWLEDYVRAPLRSRRSSLHYAVAHERVENSALVGDATVVDAKYDDDPEAQLTSIRAALPGVLQTLYTANEWVTRFREKDIDKAVAQMMQGKLPEKFGKVSSLTQLHSLLESTMAIIAITDDKKLLVEARNTFHWIATRADFARVVVQLVGSTAAVALGAFAQVAKLSGKPELVKLLGRAHKMSTGLSDAVTVLEVISGLFTLLDSSASRQERMDAAVTVTSNLAWMARGASATVGAAGFALQMTYMELKLALELYWGASVGIVSGLMRGALERLHRDGLGVAASADSLVKAQALAISELDPTEKASLERVVAVNARRLGESVDRVIADALPPTFEAGMANHPGGYPILVEALSPLKRHKGAYTPEAAAAAGRVALDRINWILSHAPEIFFAQTRREGVKEVEQYRKENDRKVEEARKKKLEGAV